MEVSRDRVDINTRIDSLGVSGMVARDSNKQGWIIRDPRWKTKMTQRTVLVYFFKQRRLTERVEEVENIDLSLMEPWKVDSSSATQPNAVHRTRPRPCLAWHDCKGSGSGSRSQRREEKGRILTFLDDMLPSVLPISILERIFTRFLDRQLRPVRVIAHNEPL